jgi:hypothetical protein
MISAFLAFFFVITLFIFLFRSALTPFIVVQWLNRLLGSLIMLFPLHRCVGEKFHLWPGLDSGKTWIFLSYSSPDSRGDHFTTCTNIICFTIVGRF